MGTIDLWIYTSDVQAFSRFSLYSGSFEKLAIAIYRGYFAYYQSGWNNLLTAQNNEWYHLSLQFDCSTHTFNLDINGNNEVTNGTFTNPSGASINRLFFGTYISEHDFYFCVDAIGYSWDTNYGINLNPFQSQYNFENDNINYYTNDSNINFVNEYTEQSGTGYYTVDKTSLPFSHILGLYDVNGMVAPTISHTYNFEGGYGDKVQTEFWYSTNNSNDDYGSIRLLGYNTLNYAIIDIANGKFSYELQNGSSYDMGNCNNNRWYHFLIISDQDSNQNSRISIYIDNVLVLDNKFITHYDWINAFLLHKFQLYSVNSLNRIQYIDAWGCHFNNTLYYENDYEIGTNEQVIYQYNNTLRNLYPQKIIYKNQYVPNVWAFHTDPNTFTREGGYFTNDVLYGWHGYSSNSQSTIHISQTNPAYYYTPDGWRGNNGFLSFLCYNKDDKLSIYRNTPLNLQSGSLNFTFQTQYFMNYQEIYYQIKNSDNSNVVSLKVETTSTKAYLYAYNSSSQYQLLHKFSLSSDNNYIDDYQIYVSSTHYPTLSITENGVKYTFGLDDLGNGFNIGNVYVNYTNTYGIAIYNMDNLGLYVNGTSICTEYGYVSYPINATANNMPILTTSVNCSSYSIIRSNALPYKVGVNSFVPDKNYGKNSFIEITKPYNNKRLCIFPTDINYTSIDYCKSLVYFINSTLYNLPSFTWDTLFLNESINGIFYKQYQPFLNLYGTLYFKKISNFYDVMNKNYLYVSKNKLFFKFNVNDFNKTDINSLFIKFDIDNIPTLNYRVHSLDYMYRSTYHYYLYTRVIYDDKVQQVRGLTLGTNHTDLTRSYNFFTQENKSISAFSFQFGWSWLWYYNTDINGTAYISNFELYDVNRPITYTFAFYDSINSILLGMIPVIILIIPPMLIATVYSKKAFIPLFVLISIFYYVFSVINLWILFLILFGSGVIFIKSRGVSD
ncbi:MAG: hypothetical protein P8Y70_01540 [Candidatus Lokiarchaeota archaeon]